jgi:hypothetical protein
LAACGLVNPDVQADPASAAPQAPSVTSKSYPLAVSEGSVATFTVTAQGSEPMKYQWQRDGVDIPGASDRCYVASASLADNAAQYSVRITNRYGDMTTDFGQLIVVGREEPMPWL